MKKVGIVGSPPSPALKHLFGWLGTCFNVQFDSSPQESLVAIDGWLGFDHEAVNIMGTGTIQAPGIVYVAKSRPQATRQSRHVQFGNDSSTPNVFRGRTIVQDLRSSHTPLEPASFDSQIASIEGNTVWGSRSSGPARIDIVGFSVPEPRDDEELCDIFHASSYVELLPLVEFLRKITGQEDWKRPATLACFMFDDPNLHSNRYGYINYARLIQEAQRHHYHVAMATVPLDTWYVDARAAATFAANPQHISLLVHGNEHVRDELARAENSAARLHRLVQALSRIQRFEQKAGIKVSRVMAPPHGACNAESLRLMAALGFEGACVSHGSLRAWNPNAAWAGSLGLHPSEIIEGLPVVPRFRIRADCQPAVLLAAYLGQPIIPVGHHQDVREGFELLSNLAELINSLPGVQWADMETVFRSNYRLKPGAIGRLHVASRHIRLRIPADITQLHITAETATNEPIDVTGESFSQTSTITANEPIPVQAGNFLTIRIPAAPLGSNIIPKRPYKMWPILRRIIAESRDRVLPLISR